MTTKLKLNRGNSVTIVGVFWKVQEITLSGDDSSTSTILDDVSMPSRHLAISVVRAHSDKILIDLTR
jgi:hypothetical protein